MNLVELKDQTVMLKHSLFAMNLLKTSITIWWGPACSTLPEMVHEKAVQASTT